MSSTISSTSVPKSSARIWSRQARFVAMLGAGLAFLLGFLLPVPEAAYGQSNSLSTTLKMKSSMQNAVAETALDAALE